MKAILCFMLALMAVLLCGRLYADPPGKPQPPGVVTQSAIAQPAIVLPPPTTQPPGKSEPPGAAKANYLTTEKTFDAQPPGKLEPPGAVWEKELPPTSYKVIRKVSIGSNRRE